MIYHRYYVEIAVIWSVIATNFSGGIMGYYHRNYTDKSLLKLVAITLHITAITLIYHRNIAILTMIYHCYYGEIAVIWSVIATNFSGDITV